MESLSELLNIRSRGEANHRSKAKSQSHKVKRATGLLKIAKEKRDLNIRGNRSHPDYLVHECLTVLEMGVAEGDIKTEAEAKAAIQNTLHHFQERQLQLVQAQAELAPRASEAQSWIKQQSQEMQTTKKVATLQASFVERVTTKSHYQTKTFLHKAMIYALAVEKKDDVMLSLSRQWLSDMKEKYTPLQITERVCHHFAMAGLKALVDDKTMWSSMPYGAVGQKHIEAIENARNVSFTLDIVERQLNNFYEWRRSDVYKQVIKACTDEARMERRLSR